jgi:hypothetical protein
LTRLTIKWYAFKDFISLSFAFFVQALRANSPGRTFRTLKFDTTVITGVRHLTISPTGENEISFTRYFTDLCAP